MVALPYGDGQVIDIDGEKDEQAVYYTWRGTRFRTNLNGFTEEYDSGFLKHSNVSILAEKLIKLEMGK